MFADRFKTNNRKHCTEYCLQEHYYAPFQTEYIGTHKSDSFPRNNFMEDGF